MAGEDSKNPSIPGWLRNSSFPCGDANLIQQIYAANNLSTNTIASTVKNEVNLSGGAANLSIQSNQSRPEVKRDTHSNHEVDLKGKEQVRKIASAANSAVQVGDRLGIVEGAYIDKRGDRNNIGYQSAFRKDVPRYFLLNTTEFYGVTDARRADGKRKHKKLNEPKRYFQAARKRQKRPTEDLLIDDDEDSFGSSLFQLNAELNRKVAQEPRDVRLWLALFRFQDILLRSPAALTSESTMNTSSKSETVRSSSKWSRKKRMSEWAIVERKLAILQRAAEANPACSLFRLLKVQLSRVLDTRQFADTAKVVREFDDLCFRAPSSRLTFEALERFALRAAVNEPGGYAEIGSHKRESDRSSVRIAPRRTFAKAIRNFVRLNSGELRSHAPAADSFQTLASQAAHAMVFDAETDRTELSLCTLQCALEFALRMPAVYATRSLDEQRALFEPFFDSNFPRFGDGVQAAGWSNWHSRRGDGDDLSWRAALDQTDSKSQETAEAEETGLLRSVRGRLPLWHAVETSRSQTAQFAYRGDASACADADRLVEADDVTALLFRVQFASAGDANALLGNEAFRFAFVRYLLETVLALRVRDGPLLQVHISRAEQARCWLPNYDDCSLDCCFARERLARFKRNLIGELADCFGASFRSRLAETRLRFEVATFSRLQNHETNNVRTEAKRVRSACKELLKQAENRNSVRLFAYFMQLESLLGNVNETRDILMRMMRFSGEHFARLAGVLDSVGQLTLANDVTSVLTSLANLTAKLTALPDAETALDCVELVQLGVELEIGVLTELEMDNLFDLRTICCAACRNARRKRLCEAQNRAVQDSHLLGLFERLFGYEPLESDFAELRIARLRRKLEQIVTLNILASQQSNNANSSIATFAFIARLVYLKALFIVAFDRGELHCVLDAVRALTDNARKFALRSSRAFHFEFFQQTSDEAADIALHQVTEWLAERLCAMLTRCTFARTIELRASELGELLRSASSAFDQSAVLAQLANLVWSHSTLLVTASQRFLVTDLCVAKQQQSDDVLQKYSGAICEQSSFSHLVMLLAALDFESLLRDRRTSTGVAIDEQAARDGTQNRLEQSLSRYLQRLESAAENCESLFVCPAALLLFFHTAVQLRLKATSRLRGLFDRALQSVPWLKALYVLGVALFPDDAQTIYTTLSERGLRIRAPVEEVDMLLEEFAIDQ